MGVDYFAREDDLLLAQSVFEAELGHATGEWDLRCHSKLNAKGVNSVYEELQIVSVPQLEDAIQSGLILKLRGVGSRFVLALQDAIRDIKRIPKLPRGWIEDRYRDSVFDAALDVEDQLTLLCDSRFSMPGRKALRKEILRRIYNELQLHSIEELRDAAQSRRMRRVRGCSKSFIDSIQQSIQQIELWESWRPLISRHPELKARRSPRLRDHFVIRAAEVARRKIESDPTRRQQLEELIRITSVTRDELDQVRSTSFGYDPALGMYLDADVLVRIVYAANEIMGRFGLGPLDFHSGSYSFGLITEAVDPNEIVDDFELEEKMYFRCTSYCHNSYSERGESEAFEQYINDTVHAGVRWMHISTTALSQCCMDLRD